MEVRTDKPPTAWTPRGRALWLRCSSRPFALLALGATLLLLGCGSSQEPGPRSSSLVAGVRAAPISPAQLAPAAALARRFAFTYAGSIYSQRPPRLPGATPAVQRHVAAAASRVPAERRNRQPRPGPLRLEIADSGRLLASLTVLDGVSPPFSVGFTLARRGEVWFVVSISPPG